MARAHQFPSDIKYKAKILLWIRYKALPGKAGLFQAWGPWQSVISESECCSRGSLVPKAAWRSSWVTTGGCLTPSVSDTVLSLCSSAHMSVMRTNDTQSGDVRVTCWGYLSSRQLPRSVCLICLAWEVSSTILCAWLLNLGTSQRMIFFGRGDPFFYQGYTSRCIPLAKPPNISRSTPRMRTHYFFLPLHQTFSFQYPVI